MYQQNSKTMTNEQKIAAEFEALLQVAKNESGKFGLHEVKKVLQEIGLTYLSEKNQLNTFKEIALNSTEQSGANLRNLRNKLNALNLDAVAKLKEITVKAKQYTIEDVTPEGYGN